MNLNEIAILFIFLILFHVFIIFWFKWFNNDYRKK